MDFVSIAITLMLVALVLLLVLRLPMAIAGNLKAGHKFRQSMSMALEELRLARMLRFLGIDKDRYLHQQPASDIAQQMKRCNDCDAKDECDQTLKEQPSANVDSLGFCANIDDLKDIRQRD
jgi:hypothetical protein